VQRGTHGHQVTVELRPAEHVDDERERLGDEDQPPGGRPRAVVFGAHEPRLRDPGQRGAAADGQVRPEPGGDRGPTLPERPVRVPAAAPVRRECEPGRVHRGPQPVRVAGHGAALVQAHHAVHHCDGHVREPPGIVAGRVQPENLRGLHAEQQPDDRGVGRSVPAVAAARPGRRP